MLYYLQFEKKKYIKQYNAASNTDKSIKFNSLNVLYCSLPRDFQGTFKRWWYQSFRLHETKAVKDLFCVISGRCHLQVVTLWSFETCFQ